MSERKPIGAKKFILVHHQRCLRDDFHFRICADGSIMRLLEDDERGQHPNAIGIVVEGNFDETKPTDTQIASLRKLILTLTLQYPSVALGAHRQVRGDKQTTCPGRRFPMGALREWAKSDLKAERDEHIKTVIESQYGP